MADEKELQALDNDLKIQDQIIKDLDRFVDREIKKIFREHIRTFQVDSLYSPFQGRPLFDEFGLTLNGATVISTRLQGEFSKSSNPFIQEYSRSFSKVTNGVRDSLISQGVEFDYSQQSVDILARNIKINTTQTTRRLLEKGLNEPQQIIFSNVRAGQDKAALKGQLQTLGETQPFKEPQKLIQETNDTWENYDRVANVQAAEDAELEWYIYRGAFDDKISDQCKTLITINRHGVPALLHRSEISQDLDPKLTRNPLFWGGHPNCRHRYNPISEFRAIQLGADIDVED